MNLGSQEQTYVDAFNLIMMLNPCPTLQQLKVISVQECETFSNGMIAQGMAVGLSNYLETTREILEISLNINNDTYIDQEDVIYDQFNSITANQTYNKLLNLFNTNYKNKTSKKNILILLLLE